MDGADAMGTPEHGAGRGDSGSSVSAEKALDEENESPPDLGDRAGLGSCGETQGLSSDASEDVVEGFAGAEGGVGLDVVREVVAADVDRLALDG